jgi:hypothetical protein
MNLRVNNGPGIRISVREGIRHVGQRLDAHFR